MSRHFSPVPALLALGLIALFAAPQQALAQTVQAAQKPVLTTLHRFDFLHGRTAGSKLTLGTDGNFYGVTVLGGGEDVGTIFKMTPTGQFITLWSFNDKNGSYPQGPLVQGADGAFYGTTSEGGTHGAGTVFCITPSGAFSTLYNFNGVSAANPQASLTLAPDGSFYGTTNGVSGHLYGVLFHITTAGTVTLFYPFTQASGEVVQQPLVFGIDGALYACTAYGSSTVFRVTTEGTLSILHTFNGTDGERAYSITAGPGGTLYGLTETGGIQNGGTAFRITPFGKFTLLHKFSQDGHGTNPAVALTLGADSLLYGTTLYGGYREKTGNTFSGRGTVFSMTPDGLVTTLYKFHTVVDGAYPFGGVVFDDSGALYGATVETGATGGYGTLYKLSLPQ